MSSDTNSVWLEDASNVTRCPECREPPIAAWERSQSTTQYPLTITDEQSGVVDYSSPREWQDVEFVARGFICDRDHTWEEEWA